MTARRFKRYPAYKQSGVEWLGEIPAHWEVNRTKFAARLRSGHTPSRQHPEYWLDCTIPWFGLADVWQIRDAQVEYVYETTEKISELGLANSAARLLPKGTVILSRTASVGFSAILGVDMATTQDFVNWICGPTVRPEYLLNVFRSMGHEFRRLTMGSTHQTIYMPDVGGFSTPIPPVVEQDRIVGVIRKETARIDSLVAKKERLIELLQEKRTALITRAVTKGLDPTVPMKDSGVEWLDQYPVHWRGLPLKRWVATKITDGPHETPELVTEGVGFISAEAVHNGKVDFDKRRGYISPDLHAYYCRKCQPVRDDILICKSGATTGKLARVRVDIDFSVWSPLAVVRPSRSRVLPEFLELALGSEYVQKQIRRTWSAGTQPNISMGDLEQLFVVAPQIEEQAKILAWVERHSGGFELLGARIREAIERLKELRTALISAAVTGKIDVREEVA